KSQLNKTVIAATESKDWYKSIVYMLKAVETTARSTSLKIKAIQSLQEQVTQKLSADIGPQYPANLSEVLFEQPYCRIKDVIEGCGVSRPTATKYLNSLVEAEIIEVQRVGR